MSAPVSTPAPADEDALAFRQYICRACGLIYDEAAGDPDSGLAPGTRYEDIPDDWACPLCGVTKADFERHVVQARTERRASPVAAAGRRVDAGVVIVGAGTAGWQMARAVRERDADVAITLVTDCNGDVYDKPQLSVALSKGIGLSQLVRETGREAAARLNVYLLAETHAVSVCPDIDTLRTTRGAIRYRHLVLAHGASPRADAALPAELCWTVNDLRHYTRFREAVAATGGPQRIVVAGAGLVGCELANDLAMAGHQLVLIDIADRPLANLLSPDASQALIDAWAPLSIRFVGGTRVRSVTRSGDGLAIATENGMTFHADHVLAATGLQTPSRLAASAGLAWNNGIAVDSRSLRTRVANIHALGDCISIDGQPMRYIEAIGRQAEVIAANLSGSAPVAYRHARPIVRVKTASRSFTV